MDIFSAQHVPEAARLLHLRHRFPHLPEIDVAQAIQSELDKPRAYGYAALKNDELSGFMIGQEVVDTLRGRHAWVRLAGHAAENPDLYVDLYTAIARDWVDHGCFSHFIMVSAADRAFLDVWFALGFGMQQAHGLLNLADAPEFSQVDDDIRVWRAAAEDANTLADMSGLIARYQMQSPIFAFTPPEDFAELRAGYSELATDGDYFVWLAAKGDSVLGFQVYKPQSEATLMHPANAVSLVVAATLPESRGSGVGRALTAAAFRHLREAGYTHCFTDWRTTNPLASRFWQKVGFEVTALRLHRRIDERITVKRSPASR